MLRSARPPSSAGIVPVNPRLYRFSAMTRSGVPYTSTPSQSLMGVSADQFSVALPARVSRAASSVSQSDTSPGLLPGTVTATPEEQSLGKSVSDTVSP